MTQEWKSASIQLQIFALNMITMQISAFKLDKDLVPCTIL